jgi:hypothetical protein
MRRVCRSVLRFARRCGVILSNGRAHWASTTQAEHTVLAVEVGRP